ncbi:M3 family oligoendopeptidase [Bacillus mesophilus]|uniref:M3 family oligoendopeptidase n=1 Tax=Bacillus mesophilus TaxID=1808955 RepID=A0A6M0Q859_9BACI|nr:M3 family oligoendopeptidase [Bacillus mesophilus]MBM7662182.1 M3 family oligoendopeptidase [Bacillus mesophilus]NEY72467.1 M3 family oligoendopeptidase [Bacillus mesophilus]
MQFNDYQYNRPNLEEVEASFNQLIEKFQNAESFDIQDEVMTEINELRSEFDSMSTLVQIRHTINTTDEFYKTEKDFFNEVGPSYKGLITNYYKVLTESKFRPQLEEKWGKQLFLLADSELKTFSPDVLTDLQEENKLTSDYVSLLAAAKIQFDGEEKNLSQLVPYQQSPDRNIRKESNEAKYNFFVENSEQLDELFDQLVKVRTRIAKKLGFSSFTELAYARLRRTDYNAEMVAKFRDQVKEYIVPLATKLKKKQQERIGVDTFKYYDNSFSFKTGNPDPKGDAEWIVDQAKKMYEEMSPETNDFYTYMVENNLMDLLSKTGKAGGGYCTYIPKYKSPYIFANFNGTNGDVRVLKHEVGHAFQVFESRGFKVPEYGFPTLEACEIHSMSMEFFSWPWMELFFKEDTDKYKFSHLSEAVLFIPYGVAVDEFQHYVYANPEATPQERKKTWREIEKKYLPHLNYEGNDFLENGGFWQQQGHIYRVPFYYIDYTLAQICALQFWKRNQDNPEAAWADYLHLCKQGGSKSFTGLVEDANLISPFEDGCVKSVIEEIEVYLNFINDQAL